MVVWNDEGWVILLNDFVYGRVHFLTTYYMGRGTNKLGKTKCGENGLLMVNKVILK